MIIHEEIRHVEIGINLTVFYWPKIDSIESDVIVAGHAAAGLLCADAHRWGQELMLSGVASLVYFDSISNSLLLEVYMVSWHAALPFWG